VLSVASTPSFTGAAFTAPSAAAKAGIVAMTRSLAVEWGSKGIRLNAVAPGLFPTPGAWERLYPPGSQVEPQELSVPLRRAGQHQELANLFAFLASDESGYITGELVVIDGGRWMQGVGGPSLRAMQDWTEEQWEALRKR
jgi:NAD(P)-dependent dehydrogenase (short-subunit alcohol dehydrogenase family)